MCIGEWTFVPFNFVKFNLVEQISHFYGQHPWHWYLSQGFPVVTGTFLPFTIYGSYLLLSKNGPNKETLLIQLGAFLLAAYSCLGHKEFRFIYPILPLSLILAAHALSTLNDKRRNGSMRLKAFYSLSLAFLLVTNLFAGIYLTVYHQRGVVDVMEAIRNAANKDRIREVVFLMPCHSTPFYSHVHHNISMKFLTCEPPIGYTLFIFFLSINLHCDRVTDRDNYVDEADLFYQDPALFLRSKLGSEYNPSHIVFFDNLTDTIADEISDFKEVRSPYSLGHILTDVHRLHSARDSLIVIG
jgi:phosphatidylinositol glycan class B